MAAVISESKEKERNGDSLDKPKIEVVLRALQQPDPVKSLKALLNQYKRDSEDYWKLKEISLFEAVKKNQLATVKYILSSSIFYLERNIIDRREDILLGHNTPLMIACAQGTPEMVKLLLKNGANLYQENHKMYSPYCCAVLNNNKAVMTYLESIVPGIITRTGQTYGGTSFMAAAEGGHLHLMEYIYMVAPEICNNEAWCGFTTFMAAVRGGHVDAIKFILRITPDAYKNEKNFNYSYGPASPLMLAAKEGHIQTMEFLLTLDPAALNFLNRWGKNALHEAAEHGQLNAVKFLLKKGAELGYCNERRENEICLAEQNGHMEVKKYLETAHNLLRANVADRLKAIQEWENEGNTLNFRNQNGDSLLHIAMRFGEIEMAWYLIRRGLSENLRNKQELTPFKNALMKGGTENFVKVFRGLLDKLNNSDYDDKEMRIKTLIEEFENLLSFNNSPSTLAAHFYNFEYLALNVNKKYWCHFAKTVSKMQESWWAEDYLAKKEKLSHLIYSGIIIAKKKPKEISKSEDRSKPKEINGENDWEFSLPPVESDASSPLDFKETEEERFTRLQASLQFALDAKDFATAMRISVEMTREQATLPEVLEASRSSEKLKSERDFIMMYMQIHFKSKDKKDRFDLIKDKLQLTEAPKV